MTSPELADLAASFRRHLRAEGRTERTCTLYLQSVRFFGDWLAAQGRTRTLDQLTHDAVRDWLADLSDRVAPGTVLTRWRGLRRFTGWLHAEGEIDTQPMIGIGKPEAPEAPVPVFSDEQLAALIKSCAGKGFAERRDEAIIRLLLDCGIRVSELCGIRVGDLDLDNGAALVTGKRGKSRHVYFGTRTTRALDRYLRLRQRHRWSHLDALLLSERGPLSPDGVRYRLQVRGRAAGLEDSANPHRFRHSFAHDFLLAGGQERDLKRLAGWNSDVMLEKYGRSAADARAEAAAKKLNRGDRV